MVNLITNAFFQSRRIDIKKCKFAIETIDILTVIDTNFVFDGQIGNDNRDEMTPTINSFCNVNIMVMK